MEAAEIISFEADRARNSGPPYASTCMRALINGSMHSSKA
jgi:hypothetical protein